ncbi:MAG: Fe-S cluster assembly ATPase SufC [Acidobacteriota bacterium]|jgi:Fe-S cluster assembly ATP-binding protein
MSNNGQPLLEVKNLKVAIDGTEILRGVDLTLNEGEIHAIMGRNGSGKSTMANVLLGHPAYEVLDGTVKFKGQDVLELDTDERARMGMFLAFQYPMAIPGVTVAKFLHSALKARAEGGEVAVREFRNNLNQAMDLLGVDSSFASRYVNDGFSGGEKKRLEILQMFMLEPSLCILDETDSGLDIDALKTVAEGVNAMRGEQRTMLLITHYQRMLNYVKPDVVHVMMDGKIVRTGGIELAEALEEKGYEWIEQELFHDTDAATAEAAQA